MYVSMDAPVLKLHVLNCRKDKDNFKKFENRSYF